MQTFSKVLHNSIISRTMCRQTPLLLAPCRWSEAEDNFNSFLFFQKEFFGKIICHRTSNHLRHSNYCNMSQTASCKNINFLPFIWRIIFRKSWTKLETSTENIIIPSHKQFEDFNKHLFASQIGVPARMCAPLLSIQYSYASVELECWRHCVQFICIECANIDKHQYAQSLFPFTFGNAIGKIICVCQMSRMLRRINDHHSFHSQRQVIPTECKRAKASIHFHQRAEKWMNCRLTSVSISFTFVWRNSSACVPVDYLQTFFFSVLYYVQMIFVMATNGRKGRKEKTQIEIKNNISMAMAMTIRR